MASFEARPLSLQSELKSKVWGSRRLVAASPDGSGLPVGEIWLAHGGSLVEGPSPWGGQRLDAVVRAWGSELLGRDRESTEFPLLLKLLDTSDWLSVQVHPDDELARSLRGPEARGKTECWYFLHVNDVNGADAEPLLCGSRPGVGEAVLQAALGTAELVPLLQRHRPVAGGSMLVPAGTPHALGPGLTLFELQQSSDLTYRMYDWDRPATGGRGLHLEESARALRPGLPPALQPPPPNRAVAPLIHCRYFVLERWLGGFGPIRGDTRRETFHAVTLLEGQGRLEGVSWSCPLVRHRTTVVPAACGAYAVELDASAQALCARLA